MKLIFSSNEDQPYTMTLFYIPTFFMKANMLPKVPRYGATARIFLVFIQFSYQLVPVEHGSILVKVSTKGWITVCSKANTTSSVIVAGIITVNFLTI